MTEVSLAWLLTKVTFPVVGATKLRHIEGAAKAVELELTDDETAYLVLISFRFDLIIYPCEKSGYYPE